MNKCDRERTMLNKNMKYKCNLYIFQRYKFA